MKKNNEEKGQMPLKPKESFDNFKGIDENVAIAIGKLWGMVWGNKDSAIEQKTKLLLSLANAVGAGRFRQATRELIKAYSLGVTVKEFDELFTLFIWNQGVGNFASEIGPSTLFGAYQLIKTLEEKGEAREGILKKVVADFGEENTDISVKKQSKTGEKR